MKMIQSSRNHFSRCAFAFLSLPLLGATISAPGIPNLHQVNDHVYRGGQPTDDGWATLAKLGVKTVVDLRRDGEDGEHSVEAESRAVRAAGMRYVSVPMKGAPAGPTDAQLAKVLEVLDSGTAVFVHCKKGKDRTGTAIACYRIAHDGWDNEKALNEAKKYGIHWYELGMRAYVRDFKPAAVRAFDARANQQRGAQVTANGAAQ